MNIEDLMLKKEELPILRDRCFQVPIHPKLLDSSVNIDENIAKRVFPQVAEEWYGDLLEYTENMDDEGNKKWFESVFLREKPTIKKEVGIQRIYPVRWEDKVSNGDNGFAYELSISRNAGGSLYFMEKDDCCKTATSLNYLPGKGYIRFSKEKALEFGKKKHGDHITFDCYGHHNIDNYPGALFLRNWAISYLNEAMKLIF